MDDYAIPGLQRPKPGKKAANRFRSDNYGSIVLPLLLNFPQDRKPPHFRVEINVADSRNQYANLLTEDTGRFVFRSQVPGTSLVDYKFIMSYLEYELPHNDYKVSIYANNKFMVDYYLHVKNTVQVSGSPTPAWLIPPTPPVCVPFDILWSNDESYWSEEDSLWSEVETGCL